MEEYTVIKRVTFSGLFPLILTDADIEDARVIIADIEVSRLPASPYLSKRTYPPNGFLAAITVMEEGFVQQRIDVEWEKQRLTFFGYDDNQVIPMEICLGSIAATNLQALAIALGTSLTIGSSDYIDALTSPGGFPQRLQFACYADTALTVTISRLKFENCTGNAPPQPPPRKPPAPVPAPKFPAGTPVDPGFYSPDDLGEDGAYAPFPIDDPGPIDPPPTGDIECQAYNVLVVIPGFTDSANFPNGEYLVQVFGVVEGLDIIENEGNTGTTSVGLICGNQTAFACVQGSRVRLTGYFDGDGFAPFIASIEETTI